MKAVVLAAAPADRLSPFTDTRAKPMIRVAGKPILENQFGVAIEYILQEPIDGIGGAVTRCRSALNDEAFLLLYGDVLTTGPVFESLMSQYVESGGATAALSLPVSSGEFGNVYLNQDMKIVELVEKPSDPHLSNYVFAGAFLLPATVFDYLDQNGNDMEACYQHMIRDGALSGSIWEGGWIDLRRPWDILEANRMLMGLWNRAEVHQSVKIKGSVQIEGPVRIEADVVIESGSVLKGPCYIGRGSYIGNNTLIREYSSLGPESVVGYGTELKNCVLFGKSTLGRLSYIGDSVIGERVHVGTGVTTVNHISDQDVIRVETEEGTISTGMNKVGAFIGDDVRLGARQVLAPGARIKSGQTVGDLITLGSIQ
jgi:bifunctional UDP-N-acetylglucosamine pyrophosphorylase/glucosamine-1-phosphate N-acetyltransferase